jgi:hypothetical protein
MQDLGKLSVNWLKQAAETQVVLTEKWLHGCPSLTTITRHSLSLKCERMQAE